MDADEKNYDKLVGRAVIEISSSGFASVIKKAYPKGKMADADINEKVGEAIIKMFKEMIDKSADIGLDKIDEKFDTNNSKKK